MSTTPTCCALVALPVAPGEPLVLGNGKLPLPGVGAVPPPPDDPPPEFPEPPPDEPPDDEPGRVPVPPLAESAVPSVVRVTPVTSRTSEVTSASDSTTTALISPRAWRGRTGAGSGGAGWYGP